jgi:hypothetical protein
VVVSDITVSRAVTTPIGVRSPPSVVLINPSDARNVPLGCEGPIFREDLAVAESDLHDRSIEIDTEKNEA